VAEESLQAFMRRLGTDLDQAADAIRYGGPVRAAEYPPDLRDRHL
jgi:hypothetical protein